MLRIKHLRMLRELTQREVPDLTDIPHPHVCHIERRRMIPTRAAIEASRQGVQVPTRRLLDHVAPTGLPDGAEYRDTQRERSFVDRPASAVADS